MKSAKDWGRLVLKYNPLSDYAEIKGGKRLPKGLNLSELPTEHPYIRVRDLGSEKTLELNSSYEYVDNETQKTISRYIVEKDDVVISIVGTIGLVGMIGSSLHGANLTENCAKIVNISGLDRSFLYYYLASEKGQNAIRAATVGAVQAKLPLKNIQALPIPEFSFAEQQTIGEILSSFDARIANNTKINHNLEQQAQAIFHNYQANGTGDVRTVADIATINPETYSEKEGWSYINYLDTSNITQGAIAQIQTIVPNEEKLPSRARRKVNANDIVYSTVRPNQRHFGLIAQPVENMLVSTGFTVLRSKNDVICNEYLYLLLSTDAIIEQLQQLAEQSVSTYPSIKPSDIGNLEILVPVMEEGHRIRILLEPIFQIIATNQAENFHLAALRDTLLPKLMSGELSVADI